MVPPSGVPILDDLWVLTFKMDSQQSADWTFEWEVLYQNDGGQRAPPLRPGPRADATTWVYANRLYLFGGFGSGSGTLSGGGSPNGYLNDVWYYNLATKKWAYVVGTETPILTATPWRRDADLNALDASYGVITPIPALPALSGASALVRTQPSTYPATVLLVGGQRFGTLSNATYFFDLSTGLNNASVLYSASPPKERVGGIFYPSSTASNTGLLYGGFSESNQLLDLNSIDLISGNWNYVCDSSFCANKLNIPWCLTCLAALPTTDYTSGLRYASVFNVNSSSGISQVSYAGQIYSTTDNQWSTAQWNVIMGVPLPHPTIPERQCSQPNPNPSAAWTFQCVLNAWEASNLCYDCPISLTLTNGPAIQITGDWAPTSVVISYQQGALINISGNFSMLNLTAELDVSKSDFDAMASEAAGNITIFESARVDSLDVALQPIFSAAMQSMVFVAGCTIRTVDGNPLWTAQYTSSGRESLGILVQWKTTVNPNCSTGPPMEAKTTNVVLIAALTAGGAFALIVAITAFAFFYSDRVRSIFSSSSASSSRTAAGGSGGGAKGRSDEEAMSHMRKTSSSSSSKAASTATPQSTAGSVKYEGHPSSALFNPRKSMVAAFNDTVDKRRSTGPSIDDPAATPRSDMDYESGLGSLETSVQDEFVARDDSFMASLAGL